MLKITYKTKWDTVEFERDGGESKRKNEKKLQEVQLDQSYRKHCNSWPVINSKEEEILLRNKLQLGYGGLTYVKFVKDAQKENRNFQENILELQNQPLDGPMRSFVVVKIRN